MNTNDDQLGMDDVEVPPVDVYADDSMYDADNAHTDEDDIPNPEFSASGGTPARVAGTDAGATAPTPTPRTGRRSGRSAGR